MLLLLGKYVEKKDFERLVYGLLYSGSAGSDDMNESPVPCSHPIRGEKSLTLISIGCVVSHLHNRAQKV